MNRTDLISNARAFLGINGHAYYAEETNSVWFVSADELADLGQRLADEQPDAYSHWCAEAGGVEVTFDRIRALKDEAGRAGDLALFDTCLAALDDDRAAMMAVGEALASSAAMDDGE